MSKTFVSTTLAADTLLAKSKAFIARALAAKGRNELGEYQLWSSLALEALGEAALADGHPCLVADPQSPASMFAAAGMNINPDVKTITAKTLFERLTHLSKRFDQKTGTTNDSHCNRSTRCGHHRRGRSFLSPAQKQVTTAPRSS
jgi:hypothetical protein